jgi:hypothetical protein
LHGACCTLSRARARAAEEPMRTERAPRVHAEKRRPAYIAHKQPEAAGYHRAGGVTCMHRWRHWRQSVPRRCELSVVGERKTAGLTG